MKLESGAALGVAAAVVCAQGANACVGPPPDPPPQFWVEIHGDTDGDGGTNAWIGLEIDLFNPGAPTQCSCGLGLSGPAAILNGLEFDGVHLSVTNTLTHVSTPIVAFDALQENANAANGYSALAPGSTWGGFSGLIPAFTSPALGPNDVIKIWFDVDLRGGNGIGTQLSQLQAVVGGGEGLPDGSPNPGGPHPGIVFTAADPTAPAPGALAAFGLAGLIGLRRRRH